MHAAEATTPPILQTIGLGKSFGGIRALDDINLSLAHGRIHAVIGPNGAGKTTLIAHLAGELKPDHGRVQFAARDITTLSSARRARLGIARCFQTTNVFLPMTLLENVMLAAHQNQQVKNARADTHVKGFQRLRKQICRIPFAPFASDEKARVAAMRALHSVGLEARADSPAAHVSHGQHRQLEIAMALAMRPKLLLLDEPAAGLDAHETARLVELLGGLNKNRNEGEGEGEDDLTMLLIEHDMDAVFALADTISVLVGGRLIATDSPQRIRANAQVQRAYLGESS